MLKRKQVVAIVSIALTCFLVGTSMASNGGNPFGRTWEVIYGLESRTEALEDQTLPQGFTSPPAYDTGWTHLDYFIYAYLEHGLNTTAILVHVGIRNGTQEITWYYPTPNTIRIDRVTPNLSWKIRVMIWRIQEPLT